MKLAWVVLPQPVSPHSTRMSCWAMPSMISCSMPRMGSLLLDSTTCSQQLHEAAPPMLNKGQHPITLPSLCRYLHLVEGHLTIQPIACRWDAGSMLRGLHSVRSCLVSLQGSATIPQGCETPAQALLPAGCLPQQRLQGRQPLAPLLQDPCAAWQHGWLPAAACGPGAVLGLQRPPMVLSPAAGQTTWSAAVLHCSQCLATLCSYINHRVFSLQGACWPSMHMQLQPTCSGIAAYIERILTTHL